MRLTELVTPLKPLEAMARGRIVLASDVGGHRELVRDKVTGYLFKADDGADLARTVIGVLAHEDDWPQIRLVARRFVETERTWQHSVANYRRAYGNALAAFDRTF
jgi:glycosyltransferase involved in cell wall biosynthesis